jgi:hypothetical protein
VRDVDHRHPGGLHRPDHLEQLLRLGHAQRGGRLVEDQDARTLDQGRRDGRLHPLRHSEIAGQGLRREPGADHAHRLDRFPAHPRQVERAGPAPLSPQEDIARDVELRHQRMILVHNLNAQVPRIVGAADPDRLAVQLDAPPVQRVHTGEDLDQRGLAGAVLADDGVHLTALDPQIDVVEGKVTGEELADAYRLEDRPLLRGRDLDLCR